MERSKHSRENSVMELREYVRILWQRGWIAVLLAVLAAGAAYVYSERQTPVYEASVRIVMRPARADLGLEQSIGATLLSLAGDISSYSFLEQALADAHVEGTSAGELLSDRRFSVVPDPGDFSITISVRHTDADVAFYAAQAIVDRFVALRQEWNERQTHDNQVAVEIPDGVRNTGIYAPKTRIFVAAGGFAGAAVGAAAIALLEWLAAAKVRTAQDLCQLRVPVLGAIPPEDERRHHPRRA
jgi:capsular polysaccharide biosynthesis protein